MTRRESVRHAVLLAFGMVMGKFDALKAAELPGNSSKAALTVNLDQWAMVVFKHRGTEVAVSVSEIYKSLQDTTARTS